MRTAIIQLVRAGLVALAIPLLGCDPSETAVDVAEPQEDEYRATVRRGPYGEAHIMADNYGSLGYGEGYAAAEDHLCTISYELLRARGELSRYQGAGAANGNIASDAVIRALDIPSQAKSALAAQSTDIRNWLQGYSAGYNRYLAQQTDNDALGWCAGADWLLPTTAEDFMARLVALALTLPRISNAIAAAAPPVLETEGDVKATVAALFSPREFDLEAVPLSGMGSNGWALGKQRTENGRGLLLANPHYPWYGGNRFWEKHLTIPGEMDAYGVSLLGTPGVAIGFNKALGWTHTVSASQRLTFYQLTLDPQDPRRYRYGDDWRNMEQAEIVVPVRTDTGSLREHEQTVFFSHYGPMLVMPNMPWSNTTAFTVRDANAGNYQLLAQWQAMGKASDMDAFIEAHRRYNAMPWVNTIASSADGRAVYLDNSTVGNLSDDAQASWRASLDTNRLAAGLYARRDIVLLDGSDPQNAWVTDPAAPLPGTVPFDQRPRLEREDYVFNANDSYWLTQPQQPLSGYSVLYGPVETARSLRTRMNIRLLNNSYGDAGDDGLFSRGEVQRALFANRGLTAELLGDELVRVCEAEASGSDAGAAIPEEACNVLATYDGTLNLDAPGAVLFREWITGYSQLDTLSADSLFRTPFSVDDPVGTPNGLGDAEIAAQTLRDAVAVLETAGVPLTASLRDTQFAWRAGEAIAVHGGLAYEGVANLQMTGDVAASPISGVKPEPIAGSRFLTDAGYTVAHGSSFILTLGFDDDGPVAEALLSYSQSGVPGDEHFKDQTTLYAARQWRKVAFHSEDVKRTAQSTVLLSSKD